jgi:hypothetical protein
MTPSHHYRIFYKEFYTKKVKANTTLRGQEVPNQGRRKEK